MPLPRFRLRTLMIAVAVVAVACGVAVAIAGPHAGFMLLVFPGPTVGAFWMGHRSKGRCIAFFQGSTLGAILVPTVLWVCVWARWLSLGSAAPHATLDAAIFSLLLSLIPSLVVAAFVAPIAWLIYRQDQETLAS